MRAFLLFILIVVGFLRGFEAEAQVPALRLALAAETHAAGLARDLQSPATARVSYENGRDLLIQLNARLVQLDQLLSRKAQTALRAGALHHGSNDSILLKRLAGDYQTLAQAQTKLESAVRLGYHHLTGMIAVYRPIKTAEARQQRTFAVRDIDPLQDSKPNHHASSRGIKSPPALQPSEIGTAVRRSGFAGLVSVAPTALTITRSTSAGMNKYPLNTTEPATQVHF